MGWFGNMFGGGKPKPTKPKSKLEEAVDNYVEEEVRPTSEYQVLEIEPQEPERKYKYIEPLDLMKVSYEPSPNKSARKGDVKYLVLHHTGPGSFNGIVSWLCNPQAKASAHYVLGTSGQLKQLVNTGKESWHAGVAKWNGKRIDNHCSIGIEICNIGHMDKDEDDGCYYYNQGRKLKKYTGKVEPVYGSITYPSGNTLEGYYVPYPEKQVEKLVALCKGIIKKYPAITRENIITHYDIGHPEGRKNDPFGLDMEMIRDWVFEE